MKHYDERLGTNLRGHEHTQTVVNFDGITMNREP